VVLVREQIRIAEGLPLFYGQEEISMKGWSLECRINAADPENDFMPSPGEIEDLLLPHGPGVRVDTMLFPGCLVPPFYDSLVLKLSVWDRDRPAAIQRMARALDQCRIGGIATTLDFHRRVLGDKDFLRGNLDTHFLERFETGG
jgi:acetyl-CoA carboxylase biotin carboxylase subunit